ncbi:MAG: ABC transporter substrate-binding protein [Nocardioidaceae bacterium]
MTGSTRRTARRWIAPLASLSLISAFAAACGGGEPVEANDSGVYEIPITVSHHPTLLYSVPYIVGMKQGFFADEKIKITEIIGSEGGGTTVRNVVTGDLPIGEVATPAAAQALTQGSDLVAVGGGAQSVAEINYVAPKGSGPSSIEELTGKSVAFTSPGSVTQGVLALSLENSGVDPKQVDDKPLGGVSEGLTALDSGEVDVAANIEPVFSSDPAPYDVVFWADEHVPSFQQTVLIAGGDFVAEQPDVVKGFLSARAKAIDWIKQNPDEAGAMWAKEADLEPQVAIAALKTVLKDDWYGVGFDTEGLQAVDRQMRLIDLVPAGQDIPWEDLIDPSMLPKGAPTVDPAQIGGEG